MSGRLGYDASDPPSACPLISLWDRINTTTAARPSVVSPAHRRLYALPADAIGVADADARFAGGEAGRRDH